VKLAVATFWMCLLFTLRTLAANIGFQQIEIPDSSGKSLKTAIWYPSDSKVSVQTLGLFRQEVAIDGQIAGAKWPVVFISHGTGGSLASHYDTALALARAGLIVIALTHTGDNSQDQSYAGNRIDLVDRPRQLERVINFALSKWKDRAHIDAAKMGVFGFSLGGFTALVEIGGVPDLKRMAELCRKHATAPECSFIRERHGDQLVSASDAPAWMHDPRIKAAVIAAPAAGYLFGSGGLHRVTVPIQLWRAANDSQAPDAWNSAIVRDGLPSTPEMHIVPHADHFAFLPPCSDALKQVASSICSDVPDFDRAAFHEEFNRRVVAFFLLTLHE
jgi:predicted dienelactone hydrolase